MTNSLAQYATTGEGRVARRLVTAALAAGYSVTVNDGAETTVHRSTRAREIIDALATTDEDILVIRDAAGVRVGAFWLIYGNACSGEKLIADYTDNDACHALYTAAHKGD